MLISEPPSPNPRMIVWAREQSGYDIERVARRLQVNPDRVSAWEQGLAPTVRQLMKLAEFLRRPLSLFYQSEPPQVRPLAAEYRRLPGVAPGSESPEFRRAVRDMLSRRELVLDLMEELDEDVPEFGLAARLSDDARAVGGRLRERIGISDETQAAWRDKWQAWREWRSAIEDVGVLVFMFPDVPLAEARGVALTRKPMPVVAVNTKEVAESRAYTALHEVVHLMLFNGGEDAGDLDQLERFAEIAASYALAPVAAFETSVASVPSFQDSDIRAIAAKFKMTPLAAATRLRESGHLTWPQYNAWRTRWNEYVSTLPKPTGFPTPVSKTIGRGGRAFAQLVFEALDTNRMTMADAARALNLRTEHFDKLRQRLVQGSIAEAKDE